MRPFLTSNIDFLLPTVGLKIQESIFLEKFHITFEYSIHMIIVVSLKMGHFYFVFLL